MYRTRKWVSWSIMISSLEDLYVLKSFLRLRGEFMPWTLCVATFRVFCMWSAMDPVWGCTIESTTTYLWELPSIVWNGLPRLWQRDLLDCGGQMRKVSARENMVKWSVDGESVGRRRERVLGPRGEKRILEVMSQKGVRKNLRIKNSSGQNSPKNLYPTGIKRIGWVTCEPPPTRAP